MALDGAKLRIRIACFFITVSFTILRDIFIYSDKSNSFDSVLISDVVFASLLVLAITISLLVPTQQLISGIFVIIISVPNLVLTFLGHRNAATRDLKAICIFMGIIRALSAIGFFLTSEDL